MSRFTATFGSLTANDYDKDPISVFRTSWRGPRVSEIQKHPHNTWAQKCQEKKKS